MTRLFFSGRVENPSGLGHLNHERRLAFGEFIAGPYPGKDFIDHAKRGRFCWHETSDLSHQTNQSHLADVSTLTRHVRACDQVQKTVIIIDASVVRDESAQRFDDVQNRVAAFDDLRLTVGGHCRTAIALFCGKLTKTSQDV